MKGLCRLSRSKYASLTRNFPSAREVVERLQEAQQVAKKSRANIWRYGDRDSDEDERQMDAFLSFTFYYKLYTGSILNPYIPYFDIAVARTHQVQSKTQVFL